MSESQPSPEELLGDLRRRYDVSETFAQRFLPLVRRALQTSDEVQGRILQLVERSFRRHSSSRRAGSGSAFVGDQLVLDKVARILHRWEPAPWLSRWSERFGPEEDVA